MDRTLGECGRRKNGEEPESSYLVLSIGRYEIGAYKVSLNDAVEMIMNNEIICYSSIGAILKAARIKGL